MSEAGGPGGGTARVLPDVSGLDKPFDYAVPAALDGRAVVGASLRVPLGGRRVRGWVLERGVPAPEGVRLRDALEAVSMGPAPAVVELARWAAWRWAGRLRPFLLAASPPRQVRELPPVGRRGVAPPGRPAPAPLAEAVGRALAAGVAVLRLPPAADRLPVVEQAVAAGAAGDVLVLVPTHAEATRLAELLRRRGHDVALQPAEWGAAAAGGRVVLGTRGAAFAPVPRLAATVVLDAHADPYVETRAPTWNAADVASERSRRAGAPCLLVSPCPTLDLLDGAALVTLPPSVEREGWPPLEVLDRRGDDPRAGLWSPRLAEIARQAAGDPRRPVVFVLNRTGRARLLACRKCGELARCESCGGALAQPARPAPGEAATLDCPRCGRSRPVVCAGCGSTALRTLRIGTGRAREELQALTGLPTAEVTATSGPPAEGAGEPPLALVGTEAVLHRLRAAALVAFVDLDQELLAPRLRAGEQALALLAAAARLAGGRRPGRGRLVVQTRLPEHEVVQAALHGDPGRLAGPEGQRRELLRLPPVTAVALVSGAGAGDFAAELAGAGPDPGGPEVAWTADGRLLVRASDHEVLCDALARAASRVDDVRIEVDPHDL